MHTRVVHIQFVLKPSQLTANESGIVLSTCDILQQYVYVAQSCHQLSYMLEAWADSDMQCKVLSVLSEV